MNQTAFNPNRRPTARPLTAVFTAGYRASTLRLLAAADTDYVDTALRCVLLLCLVATLLLCSLRVSAAGPADVGAVRSVPTWSQVVPRVPAFSAVHVRALNR